MWCGAVWAMLKCRFILSSVARVWVAGLHLRASLLIMQVIIPIVVLGIGWLLVLIEFGRLHQVAVVENSFLR